jgi:hypothetical protein
MLAEKYPIDTLKESLVNHWHPFPKASEREKWDALSGSIRSEYVRRGERALAFEWQSLPATLFLDYFRTGNRTRFETERNNRRNALGHLVLAECVEGEGRFVDQIANGVWATCEETYWGLPAHLLLQAAGKGLPDVEEPTIDLFAAETSVLLAWTHYLIDDAFDSVSPLLRSRIQLEVDRRILTPLLDREDFWWMGFNRRPDGKIVDPGLAAGVHLRVNNWNPWINSNWLQSFLLIEKNQDRLTRGVAKSMRSLDQFIDSYPEDGGCDEGALYWGRAAASLFDCLEILESATGDAVDEFDSDLLLNMGSFIYKAHIHDRYFVNFADASVLTTPEPSILYRYGKRVGDEKMASFGAWLAETGNLAETGFGGSVARQLPALFSADDLFATEGEQPLPRDVWFPEIEVMTARSEAGTADGFFLAAKGGTNAESHNHNDVGTFVVFTDGKPLLIDTGVEPYTAKSSSPDRYDIWTFNSNYHNLPQVNGTCQQPGFSCVAKSVAYEAASETVTFALDIADTYPQEAGLVSWNRTIRLNRDRDIEITDVCRFAESGGEVVLHLMTACDVEIGGDALNLTEADLPDGRVTGSGKISFDNDSFDASIEEISLVDGERLHQVWGPRVLRIALKATGLTMDAAWLMRITVPGKVTAQGKQG